MFTANLLLLASLLLGSSPLSLRTDLGKRRRKGGQDKWMGGQTDIQFNGLTHGWMTNGGVNLYSLPIVSYQEGTWKRR